MYAQLSQWVSEGRPTFFYSDFTGENFHCYLLDELHLHNIEFAFENPRNPLNYPHKPIYKAIDFSEYKKKFDRVHTHIRNGNTYLLNLTQPTPIDSPYSLKEIYTMAYAPYKLRVKDEFVCFSPEPFITINANKIHTYPMKGTIDADLPNAIETIMNDPKELAEHTMIVDLLRNDLGIVASNIRVEHFRYITTIMTGNKKLHQVSSHISGELAEGWEKRIGEILRSLLPAGSISGTPKKKTTEIIQEIEGYDRRYFSGIFGYYDGSSFYSAVSIRFIEQTPEGLIYKSGGGITAESSSEREYQEMLDKIYIP